MLSQTKDVVVKKERTGAEICFTNTIPVTALLFHVIINAQPPGRRLLEQSTQIALLLPAFLSTQASNSSSGILFVLRTVYIEISHKFLRGPPEIWAAEQPQMT
jgi:hypothetical protein